MNKINLFSCTLHSAWSTLGAGIVPTSKQGSYNTIQYDDKTLYQLIINTALKAQKSLQNFKYHDFIQRVDDLHVIQFFTQQGQHFFSELVQRVYQELTKKAQAGKHVFEGKRIVHTAPHHDDILLGYYAYAKRQYAADNQNFILYVTDGWHGVADEYVAQLITEILQHDQQWLNDVFLHFYQNSLEQFAHAYHKKDYEAIHHARHMMLCHILIEVYGITHVQQLNMQLKALQSYITEQDDRLYNQDGIEKYQQVKGRLRQSESECKWMIMKGTTDDVCHFRAKFYDDASDKAVAHDVQRMVKFFEHTQPDIVTVALDLCGIGPATHYNALHVIARALRSYADAHDCHDTITVLGYRNVWSQFALCQVDLIVPVRQVDLDEMELMFATCFATQQEPLYPSPLHDGPFSHFVRQIQEMQAHDVAQLLASENNDGMVQNIAGAVFLKKLTVSQLCELL